MRIGGGKYTTYRIMARDVIDGVLGGDAKARPSKTEDWRLVGAADADAQAQIVAELMTIPAISALGADVAVRLVDRHGTEAPGVVALGADLGLLRPLVPDRVFLEAEVAWAVRHESALSLDDVLARRTRLAQELPDRGATVAPRVAAIMGDRARLGRDPTGARGRVVPRDRPARVLGGRGRQLARHRDVTVGRHRGRHASFRAARAVIPSEPS